MFDQIIKRSHYRQRHLDAPLLAERMKYIQHWIDKGRSLSTLQAVANYDNFSKPLLPIRKIAAMLIPIW